MLLGVYSFRLLVHTISHGVEGFVPAFEVAGFYLCCGGEDFADICALVGGQGEITENLEVEVGIRAELKHSEGERRALSNGDGQVGVVFLEDKCRDPILSQSFLFSFFCIKLSPTYP